MFNANIFLPISCALIDLYVSAHMLDLSNTLDIYTYQALFVICYPWFYNSPKFTSVHCSSRCPIFFLGGGGFTGFFFYELLQVK